MKGRLSLYFSPRRSFKPNLWFYYFELVTGHQVSQYAFSKKDVHEFITRYMDFLSEYSVNVSYRPGSTNRAVGLL